METLLLGAALCLAAASTASLLRRSNAELALLLCVGAAAVVWLSLRDVFGELWGLLGYLVELSGLASESFAALFKAAVIALTARVGGAFCRDANAAGLAAALDAAGAVCALSAAAPLLRKVLILLEGWL